MTKSTKRSVWIFWLPLGLAIAIFLLVTFVGNILVIGSKLGFFSSSLEWGFYGLLTIVSIWLIAIPFLGALAKPVLALENVASGSIKADYKKLKKVARQLINAGVLPPEQHMKLAGAIGLGSDVREPLATAINAQRESAVRIIRSHAVQVFVATAISQSGRLDAIAVLVTNFRLVRLLVRHFGYRPPLPTLVKIYAQIFLAALVADEIDDLDVEGVLPCIGLPVTATIPIVGPVAKVATNSAVDGAVNALFTLRVGFVTRKCLLNAGSSLTRSAIRQAANREARQELMPVVKDALLMMPSAITQVFQRIL